MLYPVKILPQYQQKQSVRLPYLQKEMQKANITPNDIKSTHYMHTKLCMYAYNCYVDYK